MFKGTYVDIEEKDKKRMRALVDHHGGREEAAAFLGISARALGGWLKGQKQWRTDARDKIRNKHALMEGIASIASTVHAPSESKLRTVFALLQNPECKRRDVMAEIALMILEDETCS